MTNVKATNFVPFITMIFLFKNLSVSKFDSDKNLKTTFDNDEFHSGVVTGARNSN